MNLLIALSHSIPDRKEIKIKRKYEESVGQVHL
jgi:hypothetical protein